MNPDPTPAGSHDPFAWALEVVLQWEGGNVDDPADRGGRTSHGVTQRAYDAWCTRRRLPPKDVWDSTTVERAAIYRADYWNAINGDGLAGINPKMALCVFDAAVQSGPGRASRQLQRIVQAEQDGHIGKVSLSCYRLRRMTYGDDVLLENFMDLRRRFYAAIVFNDPSQAKFAKGWRNRRNAIRGLVGLEPEDA